MSDTRGRKKVQVVIKYWTNLKRVRCVPTRHPNQQRTLNKLSPELWCRNFVHKHRPIWRQKRAKQTVYAMCILYIPTELPFSIPTVGGWERVCLVGMLAIFLGRYVSFLRVRWPTHSVPMSKFCCSAGVCQSNLFFSPKRKQNKLVGNN